MCWWDFLNSDPNYRLYPVAGVSKSLGLYEQCLDKLSRIYARCYVNLLARTKVFGFYWYILLKMFQLQNTFFACFFFCYQEVRKRSLVLWLRAYFTHQNRLIAMTICTNFNIYFLWHMHETTSKDKTVFACFNIILNQWNLSNVQCLMALCGDATIKSVFNAAIFR